MTGIFQHILTNNLKWDIFGVPGTSLFAEPLLHFHAYPEQGLSKENGADFKLNAHILYY